MKTLRNSSLFLVALAALALVGCEQPASGNSGSGGTAFTVPDPVGDANGWTAGSPPTWTFTSTSDANFGLVQENWNTLGSASDHPTTSVSLASTTGTTKVLKLTTDWTKYSGKTGNFQVLFDLRPASGASPALSGTAGSASGAGASLGTRTLTVWIYIPASIANLTNASSGVAGLKATVKDGNWNEIDSWSNVALGWNKVTVSAATASYTGSGFDVASGTNSLGFYLDLNGCVELKDSDAIYVGGFEVN